ncbi:MAG: response regulator transcription factor [Gammaproteobacteria bacterium]|nr:response regulator transcription factor [Gammaproteobacteria bacterium]NNM00008.1 response regulator transcription factor [Gammaproteobacteria bacterium]
MGQSSKRVLIVDDDDLLRVGLRTVLGDVAGYEIIGEACNGHDAVKLARRLEPDIVVMDISMPDMNGIQATERICAAVPTARVLALSVSRDTRFIRQMLDAGAHGYLPKAGALDELAFAVASLESGNTYLSPSIAADVLAAVANPDEGGGASLGQLSTREREVLQLLAEGRSAADIAEALHLSVKTIETHRRNIMEKLDIRNIAQLTKFAIRAGLTTLD